MRFAGVAVIVCIAIVAAAAQGGVVCSLEGTLTAAPTGDPLLPHWAYTLVVTWDTGSFVGLSHIDLLLDPVGGTCGCEDFTSALTLVNPAGESTGDGGCTVPFLANLKCDGDPYIPGVDGKLLKFIPDSATCEPGIEGTATFVFYSNQGPVAVDEEILSLVSREENKYCFGHLRGEFPALACNPVPAVETSWGTVRGQYR